MSQRFAVLLALSALGASAPLRAQDGPPPHKVSVTISPFHLLSPELQVTGELRLAPRLSGAAIVGAGKVTDEGQTYNIWEVGGQLRFYVLGSFSHGMMLGADVGYVDVNGQPASAMEMLVGTRAGGFLGYKWSMKRGFTAEVQLGPVYVWGDDGTSEAQTLTNFKIGWSF
jgi:hypothetical protein